MVCTDYGLTLVCFTCPLGTCSRFEFSAIDLGLPFISETGFRAHFYAEWPPVSVKEAAAIIFCQSAKAAKMLNIDPEYRQRWSGRMPDFVQISSSNFQGILTEMGDTG
jgi:hypothetical protein